MNRQRQENFARGMMTSLIALFITVCFFGQTFGKTPQGQASTKGIDGEWMGTLKPPGAELRLALHISKSEDGSLKATIDSIDQGANGIPVNSISLKDSKLTFNVDSIGGSYEGKVSADGAQVEGNWSQSGSTFPLDFKRVAVPIKTEHNPAKPSDIDGAWLGTIDTGAANLRIVFHITNTEDGLTATMESLDQGAKGIPVTAVTREGAALKLEMKQLGGGFEGKITPDLSTIDGTWTQGGGSVPLVLKRR
jgi:hypothetical protein